MTARKGDQTQEIKRLQQSLEKERARVRVLSRELEASQKTLNALMGTDGLPQGDLKTVNSTVERRAIERALMEFKGNVTAVSRKLGVSRQSVYTKIRNYGIGLERKRKG